MASTDQFLWRRIFSSWNCNQPVGLPAFDKRSPLKIIVHMPAEDVGGGCRRFRWGAQQAHLDLLERPAALAVVAARAGCNQVIP